MTAEDDRLRDVEARQDYRTLPPAVRIEDTVTSVDPDVPPDPDAVRDVDQHSALRDD